MTQAEEHEEERAGMDTLISLSLYSFSDSQRLMGTVLPFLLRQTRKSASSKMLTGSSLFALIFSTKYSV